MEIKMPVMRNFTAKMLAAVAMLYVAAGCSTNEAQFPKPLEYYIGNAQPLEGERLPAEYMTKFSFGCFYTPSGFIGEMELENKKLIHFADLETGEVIRSAVSKGRGPNEMIIGPSIPRMDLCGNNLYANDIMGEKVLKISLEPDTLIVGEYFKHQFKGSVFAVNMKAASDSLFVFFIGTPTGGHLALTDNTCKVVDTLNYPVLDDPLLATDNQVNFNVSIALSPCGNWMFVCNKRYNNIRKYSISGNRITLVETYNLTEPRYTIVKGRDKMEDDNVLMNADLYAGKKYIYLRAVPETFKDYKERIKMEEASGKTGWAEPRKNTYILVFDYGFNLVKSYVTEGWFSGITLTPDPATIYFSDNENHCLVKYTLPGLE